MEEIYTFCENRGKLKKIVEMGEKCNMHHRLLGMDTPGFKVDISITLSRDEAQTCHRLINLG